MGIDLLEFIIDTLHWKNYLERRYKHCILNLLTFLSALTVAVFLVEKSGRLLNLEEGKNTVAGTINTIMSENLSLPPVALQVFCVWLISPLLRKYM